MRRIAVLAVALGLMSFGAVSAPATIFTPSHVFSSSLSSAFHGRSIGSQTIVLNYLINPEPVTCTTAQFDGITPAVNRVDTSITFTPRFPAPGGAACTWGVNSSRYPAYITTGCDWTINLLSYDNVSGVLQTSFNTGQGGCTAAMTIAVPGLSSLCVITLPVQSVSTTSGVFTGQDRSGNDTANATGPTATGSRFVASASVGLSTWPLRWTSAGCPSGMPTSGSAYYTGTFAIGPQTGFLTDVGVWGGP
jgi:hypothetical protein